MISLVLFDLDGVIRHFNARDIADIEERYGLAAGAHNEAAFSQPALADVTTGRVTRAQWVHTIGEQIGDAAAAADWSRLRASTDAEVLRMCDELRQAGVMTAVLTNGTDTIAAELAQSGIAEHFTAVFNSADIGYAKPDPRAFTHVLQALDCAASDVFVTDDSASKLAGAHQLGMQTHLFTDAPELRAALVQVGVLRD